jgi:hypothetical protein
VRYIIPKWKEILKSTPYAVGKNLHKRVERFVWYLTSDIRDDRIDENFINDIPKLIEYARNLKRYSRIDLTDAKTLDIFLAEMKGKGYEMGEMGQAQLTENVSSKSKDGQDYSMAVKDTIRMLRNMGKEVTEETVMDELGLEEWDDKYDKLLKV